MQALSYLLLIVLIIVSFVISGNVKSTFQKYSRVPSMRGYTGADAALKMLHDNGIYDVKVERVRGFLSDHYDPRNKTIRLSEAVYDQTTVSAVSVACHEAGHALQHALGYGPLAMRTTILPAASLGSKALFPLLFAGIVLSMPAFIYFGIIFFTFSVVFQLVTLPVEFNASSRALAAMENSHILMDEENVHAKKVLSAAAMTYVAAAAIAVVQLIRLILIHSSRD